MLVEVVKEHRFIDKFLRFSKRSQRNSVKNTSRKSFQEANKVLLEVTVVV